ncbi:MAG: DUF1080 domain-containing protein [Bacteroidota bacterium]
MHLFKVFVVLLLLLGAFASCEESVRLFQSDSNNWVTEGNAQWRFIEEVLEGSCAGTEGFVMTKKAYQNFELELEFYPDSTINSGVFVRCKAIALSAADCHEMNIWDLHPKPEFRTGAVVTKANPEITVNTLNKWNTYKIRCMDNQVNVWVNDSLTAAFLDDTLGTGHIGLQAAGNGTIRFRNITLQAL